MSASAPLEVYSREDLLQNSVDGGSLEYLPVLGRGEIIVKGYAHLVSGPPKVGKTELIAQSASEWDGVLYFSEESISIWSQRAKAYEAAGIPIFDGLICPALGASREQLLATIETYRPEVVVIDTTQLLGIEDSWRDSDVRGALTPFIVTCREVGATLIFVHHDRKSGGEFGTAAAGSYNFLALVDRLVEIRRDQNKENRRRLSVQSRVVVPEDLAYEKSAEGRLVAIGDPEQLSQSALKERIHKLLQSKPGRRFSQQEIEEAIGDPRPSDEGVRTALHSLAGSGEVICDPPLSGNARGRGRHWWIDAPGPVHSSSKRAKRRRRSRHRQSNPSIT